MQQCADAVIASARMPSASGRQVLCVSGSGAASLVTAAPAASKAEVDYLE